MKRLPNKPVQKKEAPVPVRCDPERSRRDKDDQGDRGDPDTGDTVFTPRQRWEKKIAAS